LIGTDTPNPFVLPGYAIHDELAGFAAAGIPVEDVLRVATVDAARFLGEEDAFGMVAPGLRADLVLLDRDPIADLDTLRDPAGVMVSGRWHARTDLNSMLEARAAELAGLEQAIEP
jgi:imidazolonepropionase-like amidohydrolase